MRNLAWLSIIVALTVTGCNGTACGPGTVALQRPDGSRACVPVDQAGAATPCDDVDGGTATIRGGVCVSRVMCNPATTRFDPTTGRCVAMGSSSSCVCPTSDASHVCVAGSLFDFSSDAASMRNVRYSVYDPLKYLADPTTPPLAQNVNAQGCFVFSGLTPPTTNLLTVTVDDPGGTTPALLERSAVGLQVVGGTNYRIDVFAVLRSTVQSWSSGAGVDFDAMGGYLALFYGDPVPPQTQIVHDEKSPIAGVTLEANGVALTGLHFLGPTRDVLDGALTTTGALGAVVSTPGSTITTFSGSGGQCGGAPCAWESHLGATAPQTIFIERFHDCTSTPTAPTCM